MTNESNTARSKWGLVTIPLLAGFLVALALAFGHGGAERTLAQPAPPNVKPPCPATIPGQFIVAQCAQFTNTGSVGSITVTTISFPLGTKCDVATETSIALSEFLENISVVPSPVHVFFLTGTITCPDIPLSGPLSLNPALKSDGEFFLNLPNGPGAFRNQVPAGVAVAGATGNLNLFLEIDSNDLGPGPLRNQLALTVSCSLDPTTVTFSCIFGTANFFNANNEKVAAITGGNSSGSATLVPPSAVGGLSVDLNSDAGRTPLDAPASSGGNAGLLAGVIAGIAALAVALTGAAWYARRRWAR